MGAFNEDEEQREGDREDRLGYQKGYQHESSVNITEPLETVANAGNGSRSRGNGRANVDGAARRRRYY
ncbi:hypothetical protein M0802_007078 [Mischocyttarus mexicanus]|nr:hypothetical protein M0802_007078 [Mischocyttarus mexicanus]